MKQKDIDRIRQFNRFYTNVLGMLNKRYLGSDFTLCEMRVMQEIYLHPTIVARDIAGELRMDKSHLSRILHKLENNGYISRSPVDNDNRQESLRMTPEGCRLYHDVDRRSEESVREIFNGIGSVDLCKIIASMERIQWLMQNR